MSHNPLSPNSDEQEISLSIITICSNIHMMGIKKVITTDMTCGYLHKLSLLASKEMYGEQKGEYAHSYSGHKWPA